MNHLSCFICKTSKSISHYKKTNLQMFDNPFPGVEMGFPLTIFENIFTKNHYGFNILTVQSILLQFAIGYFTYGGDRFFDSFDENPIESKEAFYKKIQDNKLIVGSSLFLTYLYIFFSLVEKKETLPFLYLLTSTLGYKKFKEQFGYLKPFYIGILWTLGSVILPCVMYDHNYNILNYPLDYLPSIFLLIASSSLLDIKDIDEDKKNNIETIAVIFGEKNCRIFAYIAIMISSVLMTQSSHFDDYPIQNTIFELQNLGVIFGPTILRTLKNKEEE